MLISETFGPARDQLGTSLLPGPGHNNPPAAAALDRLPEALRQCAAFLENTPVVAEETAPEAAGLVKRTAAILGECEDERTARVKPLNDEVRDINGTYKAAREPVERLLAELKGRLTAYARAEEARRACEAKAARERAEAAERAAREAEAREREALANAETGELGGGIAAAVQNADDAFKGFERAAREAARAENAVPVRMAAGYGRALSLRAKEELVLADPAAALAAIGCTEKIRDAILSSARDYRKLRGELPAGVTARINREL